MTDRYLFTDSASGSLEYTGDGDLTEDVSDFADAETVELDSHWNDFFDTDEYITFDATVAQPIVQPYIKNGKLRRDKKTEGELKRAQAQIDNLPWTMGHPPSKKVRTARQIRGFWKDPRWNDGQDATLYVPSNDPEAINFAIENDGVSIGFSSEPDFVDADEYDAIQRNIAYDHIASVEQTARCSPENGCGLHTDTLDEALDPSDPHGHVHTDAVRTQQTEEPDGWNSGDWVKFNERHGQIITIADGSARIRVYDHPDGFVDTTEIDVDNLREWVGPYVDSCPGDNCSCGCHLNDKSFTDAPSGIYVEDGNWYGISPDENADDEPKYELDNCNDVKDAYDLRNNGDYDIETSTLVERIKRAAESHDCGVERKPWVDEDDMTDSASTDNQSSQNTTMTDLTELFNDKDVTKEDVIDHYDIEQKESPEDFYDGEPTVEDLADDFDAVKILHDEKEELEGRVEDLADSLETYKREEFEQTAEELTDYTDSLGTKDELLEQFEDGEMSVDDINDKLDLVLDMKEEETTTVEDSTDSDGGADPTERDFDVTSSGKIDLRNRTKIEN